MRLVGMARGAATFVAGGLVAGCGAHAAQVLRTSGPAFAGFRAGPPALDPAVGVVHLAIARLGLTRGTPRREAPTGPQKTSPRERCAASLFSAAGGRHRAVRL